MLSASLSESSGRFRFLISALLFCDWTEIYWLRSFDLLSDFLERSGKISSLAIAWSYSDSYLGVKFLLSLSA